MTLKKSTHYALCAALEMARGGERVQVPVAQVAQRYGIPVAVLAKVFQQLVRKGIAVGTRGTRGGYSLARLPSEVTVLDVIRAFEPQPRSLRGPGQAGQADDDPGPYRLRRLIDEVDELVRCTYASVTLETLAGNRVNGEPSVRVVK